MKQGNFRNPTSKNINAEGKNLGEQAALELSLFKFNFETPKVAGVLFFFVSWVGGFVLQSV